MKEKIMMTSVVAASVADVLTTKIGLALGANEVGFIGRHMVESGMVDEAMFLRLGVAVTLMGIYALSKEYPNKYSDAIDKGVRIGNLYAWGIAALNAGYILITHSHIGC